MSYAAEALQALIEKLEEMDKNGLTKELDAEIEGLANECLITPYGGCAWENIDALRKLGYRVYPGDKDSFGWLTGVIENKKGVYVVYG